MHGIRGVCALVALTSLADLLLWRCHAECDKKIIDAIKNKPRDPAQFDQSIMKTALDGEFQIVAMATNAQNIAGKTANRCIKMNFETKDGRSKLTYEGLKNWAFPVKLDEKDGVLISTTQDDQGPVQLRHQISYMTREIVAFYICSDAAGDPALSVVAISGWFAKYYYWYTDHVNQAKRTLVDEGVTGFGMVPVCK